VHAGYKTHSNKTTPHYLARRCARAAAPPKSIPRLPGCATRRLPGDSRRRAGVRACGRLAPHKPKRAACGRWPSSRGANSRGRATSASTRRRVRSTQGRPKLRASVRPRIGMFQSNRWAIKLWTNPTLYISGSPGSPVREPPALGRGEGSPAGHPLRAIIAPPSPPSPLAAAAPGWAEPPSPTLVALTTPANAKQARARLLCPPVVADGRASSQWGSLVPGLFAHSNPPHVCALPSLQGSVALSLCTTDHPLHTRFTNIFGASVSEATMRPHHPRACRSRAAGGRGRGGGASSTTRRRSTPSAPRPRRASVSPPPHSLGEPSCNPHATSPCNKRIGLSDRNTLPGRSTRSARPGCGRLPG
jgi:hypothetical protein